MTFRARVVVGLWWTAGSRLLEQVCTWAITIVVMRLLSPADYGLLAMATIFTAFLSMMAELGLGNAVVQAAKIEEIQLRRVFGLVLLVNLSLFTLLLLAAPAIASFFA